MARKSPPLAVVIVPSALRDLEKIWDYNAEEYGEEHAEVYVSFLRKEAYKLNIGYRDATPVPIPGSFFQVTIRKGRSRNSHAHLAIFQIVDQTVEVLRFFHTSQDWQNRFKDGR